MVNNEKRSPAQNKEQQHNETSRVACSMHNKKTHHYTPLHTLTHSTAYTPLHPYTTVHTLTHLLHSNLHPYTPLHTSYTPLTHLLHTQAVSFRDCLDLLCSWRRAIISLLQSWHGAMQVRHRGFAWKAIWCHRRIGFLESESYSLPF